MNESIFTLWDRVALGRVGSLVVNRSDAAVTRMFQDLLESDERMRMHADDYEMRKVGMIDDDGAVTPIVPLTIATGAQWRASQTPKLAKEG